MSEKVIRVESRGDIRIVYYRDTKVGFFANGDSDQDVADTIEATLDELLRRQGIRFENEVKPAIIESCIKLGKASWEAGRRGQAAPQSGLLTSIFKALF